jgi:hypothetical protein
MNNHCTSSRCIAVTRETKRRAVYAGLCALSMAVAAGADSQPRIITFDVPGAGAKPGSFQGTVAACYFTDCSVVLNNFGAITGSYLDANNVFHGFLRSPDGHFTTFDAPGAGTAPQSFNGTAPNAINDSGAITGPYYDANGLSHGFLRSPEGAFITFDVPDSTAGTTTPIALNLQGAIVGYFADQNGVTRGFLRRPDGTFATWIGPGACDATPATGCFGTAAHAVNLFGTVSAGYEDNSGNFVAHGLVRSPEGKFKTYNVPGAGTGLYQGTGCPGCSRPINLFGAIASYYIDANNVVHGFLRSPDGTFTTFEPPGVGPNGMNCYADCSVGLNDLGAITGVYLDTNNVNHGFVRSPWGGNIFTFEAPGADTTAGSNNGTFPVSINDWGAVAGYYIDANSVFHGFLLLP